MFRALILDWSGTLVDDMGPTLAATNAVLARFQKAPLSRDEFRQSFRLPYSEFYEEILPGVPLAVLEEHFREAFDASGDPVTPLEGTAEFLAWCAASGIRLFVLTSMDPAAFKRQLREFGFEGHFEATYAGVLDKRLVIRDLLRKHGLRADETAYVGDMSHDIEAARHGGITPVGVLSGYDPRTRLAAARPELLFSCVRSLHALLARWRSRHDVETTALAPDRIEVRRLQVEARVGVPDAERARPQRLFISLAIVPVRGFEALRDDVGRTVDYEAVANRIKELAAERPRRLIETLAHDVAGAVLREFPAAEVTVEVEKHILPATDAVAVWTRRRRPGD